MVNSKWRMGERLFFPFTIYYSPFILSARKLVADAMNGDDVVRVAGSVFDLLAELGDVHVNGACERQALVAPDVVEELVAADDLAATLDEVAHDLELAGRKLKLSAPLLRFERFEVELDV